jgi:tetratricopeptide (TPR) repeat protein
MASSARIDELRKKFEENPRRYFAPLANEYRKAGQIDQAIAICREYLPQQPGHMSGHIVYGQALYEARQFEEAKGVFETALSLDPENLIALRHLGDIALLIGDSDAARTWYRRVLEADPRNEEIQAQLLTLEQSTTPTSAPAAEPKGSSAPTVVVDTVPGTGSASHGEPLRPSGEVRRLQPWARKTPAPGSQTAQSAKTVEIVRPVIPTGDTPAASSIPTPTSIPTIELEMPVAGTPSGDDRLPIESAAISGLETTSLTGHASIDEPSLTSAKKESGPIEVISRVSLTNVPAPAEPAPVAAESGPFVTETMAELYLQQGHREEALRVYRALLDQRPEDEGLKDRVGKLESELATAEEAEAENASPVSAASDAEGASPVNAPSDSVSATSAPATPGSDVPSPPAGPTIRQVLEIIAERRPGYRPPSLRENGTAPQSSRPDESNPPEARRDTLSTLFSSARISTADEGAALVLALAFTELNNGADVPNTILEGAPAHRASNELSLDTVFGGRTSAGGGVSYDEFFAQRPSGPQANADPQDDVAAFAKWLEGLKRR